MIKTMIGLCAVSLLLTAQLSHGETTQLRCGEVFDAQAGRLIGPKSIVVEERKIVSISDRGNADRTIDLSAYTCLPGLMDMHVHLSSEQNPRSYVERFTLNTADHAFRSVGFAERTLMAGFTTVRDLGDSDNVTIALRNAIAAGHIVGPRIFTAGKSIATTGGHADPSSGYRDDLSGDPGPRAGVINGPDEARKAVRQRYKNGADLIKITATGGVLSTAKNGLNPQFSAAELEALIATANDYGFKVAAHAHGAEGMQRAIEAGVASIEHGTMANDEIFRLMKQHGTYLVPTMMAGAWVVEKAKIDGYFPAIVRPKAAAIGPLMAAMVTRAIKAGVKIAFGTDSGVSEHGNNAQEFALMVAAGMTEADALRAATVVAAELVGQSESLGLLKTGMIADVVAVAGNPLTDISRMTDIAFVMKDGKVYKQPAH